MLVRLRDDATELYVLYERDCFPVASADARWHQFATSIRVNLAKVLVVRFHAQPAPTEAAVEEERVGNSVWVVGSNV